MMGFGGERCFVGCECLEQENDLVDLLRMSHMML
jgi:hypothetical protein